MLATPYSSLGTVELGSEQRCGGAGVCSWQDVPNAVQSSLVPYCDAPFELLEVKS
jgi:hypothetical protein